MTTYQHDNGTSNDIRHVTNPYPDWNEETNNSILNAICAGTNHITTSPSPQSMLHNNSSAPIQLHVDTHDNTNQNDDILIVRQATEELQQEKSEESINQSESTITRIENFAISTDGHFDKAFQNKLKEQLKTLLSQHVKSEQIDCNDRSVYTGLPGISLLYHHLSANNHLDSKFREELASQASHHVNQYLTSIQTAHLHNSKCPSYLCGDLGVYTFCAVARNQQRLHREALVRTLSDPGSINLTFNTQGANSSSHASIEQINSEPNNSILLEKILELIKMQEQPGTPDELLYGRTGGLYAMLIIKKYLPKQTIIKDEHIIDHIALILKSGQTMESFGRPLFYSWHGKEYVGAAHGYSGILYILLEAHKYLNDDQLKLVKDAINFVEGTKYPSHNYPSSIGGQTDRLVHWCHGAPGVVHMLVKAYQVYGDETYLNSALACGDVIWERGLLKKGFSLCHGVSGNAYAFLRLYQLTRDLKHLYRAGKFAQFYLEYKDTITWRADSPASLFEGYAGLSYFLADLLNPSEARFPAFQLSTTLSTTNTTPTKSSSDKM